MARVYWNDHQQNAFLEVNQLPEAPAGKQYQLWAIVAGEPVASAANGLDQLVVSGGLQGHSQAAYVDIDGAFLDEDVVAPYVIEQLGA